MTIYGVRQRVACYVTRAVADHRELLVFSHVDDDPADPSGVQIPAGGMARFEAIETAARREVLEETGLVDVSFEAQLGAVELGLDHLGGPSVTTFVHLSAPADGRPSWTHLVSGTGDDAELAFSCWWERLPLRFELASGQGAYLDWLPMS